MPMSTRFLLALLVPLALAGCASARPLPDRVVTSDIVAMVEWRVEACTRGPSSLTCGLVVTNRGPDGTLVVSDSDVSAFVEGTTLTLRRLQWAGAVVAAVNARLPQGVPQRLEVEFGGVTGAPRGVRLLEIKASLLNRADSAMPGDEAGRPVQLRNLAIR